VFYSVLVIAMATAGSEACGQAAAPVGAGGTCTLTPDCAEGYACITQPNGSRQCSNDFSSIQSTEDASLDVTTAPANDAAPGDDASAPPDEAGTPPGDSGSTPPDSGAAPQDTGSPPQDTGAPPEDTGTLAQDTGTE
jgi:hypothetical protein